jgi:hypothetical protein
MRVFTTAAALLALSVATGCQTKSSVANRPPSIRLAGSANSVDALVDQFLRGLERGDREALERIRISEREYVSFILPGSAPEGQKPQAFPDKKAKYFWGMNHTRSSYALQRLLNDFGGRSYRRKTLRYGSGTQQYAWYTAHKDLELVVEDGQGREVEVHTGSIAEIDGQFKFISYFCD